MIKECEKNNVKLGVAYYRHYYPIIIRVKELIKKGEIGKPLIAQINAFMNFDRTPGEPRYWLLEKEKSGGGPMMDFGCHRLEIFNNLFGPAKKVIGTTHNLYYNRGVEDTATAIIKYNDNVLASLIVTHAAMEPQDTLSIFGTKGSIHIPVLEHGKMNIITEKAKRMETHPADINVHYPCIENFVNSVIHDKTPVVNGQVGLQITRTLDKIYGKQVR
jgi:predicted dehydrogenase